MEEHALWFYMQIVRWGHVAHTPENLAIARDCYRPDLYRSPFGAEAAWRCTSRRQFEGRGRAGDATPVDAIGAGLVLGPDGFFDGQIFDPDEIDAYIAAQKASQLQG